MDTGPRSNFAYLPEEYIRDGKLSDKLDIYSIGMVSRLSHTLFPHHTPTRLSCYTFEDLLLTYLLMQLVNFMATPKPNPNCSNLK